MRATFLILIVALAADAQDRKETALGAQLAREVRQRTTAIDNPVISDYVDRIGRKLTGAHFYTFALISDDAGGETHEPLSFPGGYLFISAALIQSATNESEFAGMLAHAMAHVTLPPARSGNSSMPIIFMGGWTGFGPASNGSLLPISLLQSRRDNESRADAIAIQVMSAAGYDPEALAAYIARVQAPPGRTAKLFEALPDREARIDALRKSITALPAGTYSPANPDEFRRMQEQVRIAVLPVQERPRPTLQRQNE